MTKVSPFLSIIILNINGLNSSIKRNKVIEQTIKQDPAICYLQETRFIFNNTHKGKSEGVKKW